jgi:hypothetical protein
MLRIGTVLVFKPRVTQAQVEAALRSIEELLSDDWLVYPRDPDGHENYAKPPRKATFRIETFDDRSQSPVWYCP